MINKLGTIDLSPDILKKANIGLWAFELDVGKAPRMYVDETMLKLIGLDHQVSPEETYHAWYDHIDENSYGLVANAVEKMTNGEHSEVQYPWHHPNGKVMIVRCGGVRNYEYTKGVRIEGTHQDVTYVFHLSDQQKQKESLLNYFVNTYDSAYFVNLRNDTFEIIYMDNTLSKHFGTKGNDRDTMLDFIDKHINPEDKDLILQMIDKEYVRARLKNEPTITFTIREVFDDVEMIKRCLIIAGTDEDHIAVGFMDVTKETLEEKKHLLGAIPLSSDVLTKANIGLWSFELDEGKAPRMYVDEAMLKLIGLDHQVSPEETYHAWYDNIDENSYDLVADAVEKMTNGQHAEVQYPWHYPDGRIIVVRCGGVRNFEYTKGIRIEGTHQNVSQIVSFNEEERKRYNEQKKTLVHLQFRVDALKFVVEEEPSVSSFIEFFGQKIIDFTGCDQVIFRDTQNRRCVKSAEGIEDLSSDVCSKCIFSDIRSKVYKGKQYVLMNDCKEGYEGYNVHEECIVKSSFMKHIYLGDKYVGMFTIHYLKNKHNFTQDEIDIISTVANYLGILFERAEAKKTELDKIEAESSNKAKTEFLFNMSHDIRTPMNAIIGFTDIAMNHINDINKVQDYLTKIKYSSHHLLNLINDILEMSRIEAGKLEIEPAYLNIREAIEKINIMSESLATSKSISYESTITGIKDEYIFADELHVNEILINLISNAVKYTLPGGKVQYHAEQIESKDGFGIYRFTISDTGIGMSEEFQSHLFESFSREKTKEVSTQEGAGLGLAIVKKILDLLNGTIKVKSKKGVGSTFIVEIPFKLMSENDIKEFKKSTDVSENKAANANFKNKKVLLVEDNELNREIATEILSESGLIVESANDGDIAVKVVKEKGTEYYDFILMDIQMPFMNGYEATKNIRKLPNGNIVPIIALSANAFEEDKIKSIQAGMNDHIAKPINIKELFETIAKYLKG